MGPAEWLDPETDGPDWNDWTEFGAGPGRLIMSPWILLQIYKARMRAARPSRRSRAATRAGDEAEDAFEESEEEEEEAEEQAKRGGGEAAQREELKRTARLGEEGDDEESEVDSVTYDEDDDDDNPPSLVASRSLGEHEDAIGEVAQLLVRDRNNGHLSGRVGIITWNAERVLQALLLMRGNGKDARHVCVISFPKPCRPAPVLLSASGKVRMRTRFLFSLRIAVWEHLTELNRLAQARQARNSADTAARVGGHAQLLAGAGIPPEDDHHNAVETGVTFAAPFRRPLTDLKPDNWLSHIATPDSHIEDYARNIVAWMREGWLLSDSRAPSTVATTEEGFRRDLMGLTQEVLHRHSRLNNLTDAAKRYDRRTKRRAKENQRTADEFNAITRETFVASVVIGVAMARTVCPALPRVRLAMPVAGPAAPPAGPAIGPIPPPTPRTLDEEERQYSAAEKPPPSLELVARARRTSERLQLSLWERAKGRIAAERTKILEEMKEEQDAAAVASSDMQALRVELRRLETERNNLLGGVQASVEPVQGDSALGRDLAANAEARDDILRQLDELERQGGVSEAADWQYAEEEATASWMGYVPTSHGEARPVPAMPDEDEDVRDAYMGTGASSVVSALRRIQRGLTTASAHGHAEALSLFEVALVLGAQR
jgi:hypothetical protein